MRYLSIIAVLCLCSFAVVANAEEPAPPVPGDAMELTQPVEDLVDAHPAIAAVVGDFVDGAPSAPVDVDDEARGVTLVRTDGLAEDLSLPTGGGFGAPALLESVSTPRDGSAWQEFAFADGVVRVRLEGAAAFGAAQTTADVVTRADVLAGVDAHYLVRPDGIEELLEVGASADRASFAWTMQLPAGWRLEQRGEQIWIVDANDWRRLEFSAPIAQASESGEVIVPQIEDVEAGDSRVVVAVPERVMDEGYVLDPKWIQPGPVGQITWRSCGSGNTSGCAHGNSDVPAGWTASASSGDSGKFEIEFEQTRGAVIVAKVNEDLDNGDYARWTYVAPTDLTIDEFDWLGFQNLTTGSPLRCRIGAWGGSSYTWQTSVGAGSSNDYQTTGSGGSWTQVALEMYHSGGGTFNTSSSVPRNACVNQTLSPQAGNERMSLWLTDDDAPSVTLSTSPGDSNDLYGPNDATIPYAISASDQGSGINLLTRRIDAGAATTVGSDCDPSDAYAAIPCPLTRSHTGQTLDLSSLGLADGDHDLVAKVTDYAKRTDEDAYEFTWDDTAPTTPSGFNLTEADRRTVTTYYYGPIETTYWGVGSSVAATWTAATDAHLLRHEIRIVGSGETCTGASTLSSWTTSTTSTSGSLTGLTLDDAASYILCVRAIDSVGNVGAAAERAFTVDLDAPTMGTIDAPTKSNRVTAGSGSWGGSPATDSASGIANYELCASSEGDTPGPLDCDLDDWSVHAAAAGSGEVAYDPGLDEGDVTFVCGRAYDHFGRASGVSCDSTQIDITPPTPPTDVVDGSSGPDVDWTDPFEPNSVDDHLDAHWTAPSSGDVEQYWACFTSDFTCEGNAFYIMPYLTPSDTTAEAPTYGALTPGLLMRFCIKAIDDAGNQAEEVCSDGQVVDGEPPRMRTVRDGAGAHDESVSQSGTTFDANWDAALFDATVIDEYEWKLCELADCTTPVDDGTTSSTSIALTGLTLADGGRYRVCVEAVDTRGRHSAERCSNGLQVVSAPPSVPLVPSVHMGLASVPLPIVEDGKQISARWFQSPSALGALPVEWEICSGAPCDELGSTSEETGTATGGTLTSTSTPAVVGTRYWACVSADSWTTSTCSAAGAIGGDTGNTTPGGLPVNESSTSARPMTDVDTMVAGDRYTAGWEANGTGSDRAHYWELCSGSPCTTIVASGISLRPTVSLDPSVTTVGNTYQMCVVMILLADGTAPWDRNCSDGVTVTAPSGGTVVTTGGGGNLVEDTVWTEANSPYIVNGVLEIGDDRTNLDRSATLTIEPGAVVKFADDASINVLDNGSHLYVDGTTGEPVTFTSIHDDEVGGDSDGDEIEPARGDWYGVVLQTDHNSVRGLEMRYGSTFEVIGHETTIRDSSFHHNGNPSTGRVLNINGGRNTLVERTSFTDNVSSDIIRVEQGGSIHLTDSEVTGNTGQGLEIDTWLSDTETFPASPRSVIRFTTFENTIAFSGPSDVYVYYSGDGPGGGEAASNAVQAQYNNFTGSGLRVDALAGSPNFNVPTSTDWRFNYWDTQPVHAWCEQLPYEGIPGNYPGDPDIVPSRSYKFRMDSSRTHVAIVPYFALEESARTPAHPHYESVEAEDWCTVEHIDNQSYQDVLLDYPQAYGTVTRDNYLDPSTFGFGDGGHAPNDTHLAGDPTNTLTRNFVHRRSDVTMSTPGAEFELVRTYNARDPEHGLLGDGWSTPLDSRIDIEGDTATFRSHDGQRLQFRRARGGGWVALDGTWSTMVDDGDGHRITMRDGTTLDFDEHGRFFARLDVHGNGYTVVGVPMDNDLTIRDTAGRSALLSIDDITGRLESVEVDDGREVVYEYDGSEPARLVGVTDVNGGEWQYAYDVAGRLACEVNPNGHLVFENEYGDMESEDDGLLLHQWDAARGACSLLDEVHVNVSAASTSFTSTGSTGDPITTEVEDPAGKTWTSDYDASGRLVAQTDPTGRCTSIDYDVDGSDRDVKVTVSQRGLVTTETYDAQGRVLERAVSPADGGTPWHCDGAVPSPASSLLDEPFTDTWTYDAASGKPTRHERTYEGETDPSDVTIYTVEDGNTTRVERVGASGSPTSHCEVDVDLCTDREYDPAGQLVSETDELGHETTYEWDERGLLEARTPPDRGTTRYSYDARGRLTGMTAPHTSAVSGFVYARRFVYDDESGGDHRLWKEIDPYGGIVTFDRDAAGNVVHKYDLMYREWNYAYNDAEELTSAVGPDVNLQMEYDERGLLTAQVDTGDRTEHTYDDAGRPETTTGPRGFAPGATAADHRWTYAYDEDGNRAVAAGPEGARVDTGHDLLGRTISTTRKHVGGGTTTIGSVATEIDDVDRLVTTRRLAGSATSGGLASTTELDEFGRAVERVDERGQHWQYVNDAAGNLLREISPEGRITGWEYDESGAVTRTMPPRAFEDPMNPGESVADPFAPDAGEVDDHATDITRDPASGAVLEVAAPEGRTTTYERNPMGRLRSVANAEGEVTKYAYDAGGRIRSVINPSGQTTQLQYTDWDPPARAIYTPAGRHVAYTLDARGRVTSKQLPSGRTWNYAYEPGGELARIEDPVGVATSGDPDDGLTEFTYDGLGRRTSVAYSDTPGADATWAYDDAASEVEMTDAAGTEVRSADGYGRIEQVARSGHSTIDYTWGAGDLLDSREVAGGDAVDFGYDDDGLETSSGVGARTTTYDRDLDGLVTEVGHPAGPMVDPVVEQRAYDDAGDVESLVVEQGASTLRDLDVTRDAVGRITEVDRGGGDFERYAYDANGRLGKECYATPCDTSSGEWTSYAYDRNGNRSKATDQDGVETRYGYDADDRLTATRTGSDPWDRLTYDARGNLLDDGANRFWYDQAGHVTGRGATGAGSPSTSYVLDGRGRRVREGTTRLAWDDVSMGVPQVVAELDQTSGDVERSYTHGPLGVETLHEGSDWYDYGHGPTVGNVEQVIDEVGAVAAEYAYSAFGEERGSSGALDQPFQFANERLNPAGGTYHFRARDYAPSLGVFTGPDPVERGATQPFMGTQAYAEQNPTYLVDPTGESAICDATGPFAAICRGGESLVDDFNDTYDENDGDVSTTLGDMVSLGDEYLAHLDTCTGGGVTSTLNSIGINAGEYEGSTRSHDASKACDAMRLDAIGFSIQVGAAASPFGRKPRPGGRCTPGHSFAAGTLVLMADGSWKPIQAVKVGDRVIATDPLTGKSIVRRVDNMLQHVDDSGYVRISAAGGSVIATGHHPIWNDTIRRWQRADTLGTAARVLDHEGHQQKVSISSTAPTSGHVVYDLTIEDTHTYHVRVGATDMLVHNCGGLSRMDEFAQMAKEGIDGYSVNPHLLNSLRKSGRRHITPDDVRGALATTPGAGTPGSMVFTNPTTGTQVFVSSNKEIVGVWPKGW